MQSLRFLCPNGHLGFAPIKTKSFHLGVATKPDFILAVGDDWTDEYTFDAMPEGAYTIKVGAKTTKADYYIENVELVRELLCRFRKDDCHGIL